jgi:hypothetical protein
MILRAIHNLLVFAGVGMACAFLVPRPIPAFIYPTYRTFVRERDNVELIFVGSSRTRQIDRSLFEAEVERRGYPTLCLNLGVNGMAAQEAEVFLKTLLRHQPKRLKYILVEIDYLELTPRAHEAALEPEENEAEAAARAKSFDLGMGLTQRRLWYSTPTTTLRMIHMGQRAGMEADFFRQQLRVAFRRASPIGLGYDHVNICSIPEPESAESQQHLPIGSRNPDLEGLRAQYPERLGRTAEVNSSWDRELQVKYLRKQAAFLGKKGYEVVYLIPPRAHPGWLSSARELMELLPEQEIWSYANPDAYPELYALSSRIDHSHLSMAGIEAYARLLAERFAEYRRRTEGDPRGGESLTAVGGASG